jgi:hypothetical protein
MPVDKFGRSDEKTGAPVVDGVSLKYVNTNFQRKNEVGDNVKSYVAAQTLLTKKKVEGCEQIIQETIIPHIIAPVAPAKPLITICAEARGKLEADMYQWGVGPAVAEASLATGYVMLAPGKILRMGLTVGFRGQRIDDAGVVLVVNGSSYPSYSVTKQARQKVATKTVTPPLQVDEGDEITFRTMLSTDGSITSAVVNLLIELDL